MSLLVKSKYFTSRTVTCNAMHGKFLSGHTVLVLEL